MDDRGWRSAKVTAADVAQAADVSTATVSLVVNGNTAGRVSAGTQQRVRDAVTRLGYRVDRRARGLARGTSGVVSLVVADLDSPFMAAATMAVHEALGSDTDLQLIITSHDPARLGRSVERALASGVDGLLLGAVGAGVLDHRTFDLPFPVVVMDDPTAATDLPRVEFDLRSGTRALVAHLVALGHSDIAYLAPRADVATFRTREAHLAEAVDEMVAAGRLAARLDSDTTADDACRAVSADWPGLAARGVTALICASDVQGYGALHAFARLGRAVPEDVSVASFDSLPMARVVVPSLTAVALPAAALGHRATAVLLEMIATGDAAAQRLVVPTHLDVRGSTGPAPMGR